MQVVPRVSLRGGLLGKPCECADDPRPSATRARTPECLPFWVTDGTRLLSIHKSPDLPERNSDSGV